MDCSEEFSKQLSPQARGSSMVEASNFLSFAEQEGVEPMPQSLLLSAT